MIYRVTGQIDTINEISVDRETIDLIKNWKTANDIHRRSEFKSNSISDDDYEYLRSMVDLLKSEKEDFRMYKMAFKELCKYCHIAVDGTIITKYELKKGGENKNYLYVEYTFNNKLKSLCNAGFFVISINMD